MNLWKAHSQEAQLASANPEDMFPPLLSVGFPGGSDSKESACNAGDLGLIPGPGRSPGEGNGNPLQYSCPEIPWTEEPGGLQSTGCKESIMTERLTLLHVINPPAKYPRPGAKLTSYLLVSGNAKLDRERTQSS